MSPVPGSSPAPGSSARTTTRRCAPRARPLPPAALPPAALPLIDPADAVAVLGAAASVPARAEVIAILLDEARRGLGVLVVTDAHPGHELDVLDALGTIGHTVPAMAAVVLGSVRPDGGIHDADEWRWLELLERADDLDVDLIDWFVLDGCLARSVPFDTGATDRW